MAELKELTQIEAQDGPPKPAIKTLHIVTPVISIEDSDGVSIFLRSLERAVAAEPVENSSITVHLLCSDKVPAVNPTAGLQYSFYMNCQEVCRPHVTVTRFLKIKDMEFPADDTVILMDSRDSVFQHNPFAPAYLFEHSPCVHFYTEIYHNTLFKNEWSRAMLWHLLGINAKHPLFRNSNIICGGFMMGKWSMLKRWVTLLIGGIKPEHYKIFGADQPYLNAFYYLGYHPSPAILHQDFEGFIFHMHGIDMPANSFESKDCIVDVKHIYSPVRFNEGHEPCILHQYDRNLKLLAHFKNIYLGGFVEEKGEIKA